MSENKGNGLIDKIMGLPKWALFSLAGVLIGVFIFFAYLSFAPPKGKDEGQTRPNILLDVPDGVEKPSEGSLVNVFEKNKQHGHTAADFWDDDEEGFDSVFGSKGNPLARADADSLDPAEYNELERRQIASGTKTKEEIDREHARKRAEEEEFERRLRAQAEETGGQKKKYLTQEQLDSMSMAKFEKAMQLAQKYQGGSTGAKAEPEPAPAPEEQFNHIDLSSREEKSIADKETGGSYLGDDGIISSLDGLGSKGGGPAAARPVKATFLKSEKVVSGQRVIIRLLEDMELSNGITIPANTHLTGYCDITSRMRIRVKSLHYGSRIVSTDISAYDNDGTEGIYCPIQIQTKKKRDKQAAGQAAEGIVSGATSAIATLLTGNPFLGSSLTSGANAMRGAINADGQIEVNLSSGYEFYMFENITDKDKS